MPVTYNALARTHSTRPIFLSLFFPNANKTNLNFLYRWLPSLWGIFFKLTYQYRFWCWCRCRGFGNLKTNQVRPQAHQLFTDFGQLYLVTLGFFSCFPGLQFLLFFNSILTSPFNFF